MSRSPTIGIDVGATKIAAAVVDGSGNVLHHDSRRIKVDDGSDVVEPLLRAIAALREMVPEVAAVGVGMAGLVDYSTGTVGFAANHRHGSLQLRSLLQAGCNLPVVVDNDANAAALAEVNAGRYPGENLLFLAVGTGLGSGYVFNGKVMRLPMGGGELGHLVVDPAAPLCTCGRTGCLEVVASGLALKRAGERIIADNPNGSLSERVGWSGSVSARVMIDAAQAGDPEVLPVVAAMGEALGAAVANTMSLLPVDHVIVGGGLSALRSRLLGPMQEECEKALSGCRISRVPLFALAAHGRNATLLGAGLLARDAEQ